MKDLSSTHVLKYVFVAIAIAELCGHALGWKLLNEFTKPLLVPVLLVYFRQGLKVSVNLSFILAVFALVFSWFGDVALMYVYKRDWYFLLGLGAFAIAQSFYFFSFKKAQINYHMQAVSLWKPIVYTLPLILCIIGLLWMVWPTLGGLKIPVVIYAILISLMMTGAVSRSNRTNVESFNQVAFGALLFILSDALIAIDTFYAPMENASIWVMSTYMMAQWNIINGLHKHYNDADYRSLV